MKSLLDKRLLIISDTPMYGDADILVFEPTLEEVERIADLFSSITWISYKRDGVGGKDVRMTRCPNIQLLPIRNFRGGESWKKKALVLFSLPRQVCYFLGQIKSYDIVHTRGPSVPALLGIMYSFLDRRRIYWHKYAGNWREEDSPWAFRVQRWLLSRLCKRNIRITVNGAWPGLHTGFLPMENPCLSSSYLEGLKQKSNTRSYFGRLKVCFVGALSPFKGAKRLVQALTHGSMEPYIDSILIVGDGEEKGEIAAIACKSSIPVHLSGFMSRESIFESVYATCHFLVLPSESEGFPKVVAEASAHRCIPVVTSVSALNQYISDGFNGFLLTDSLVDTIRDTFMKRIIPNKDLGMIAERTFELSQLFTYERFHNRIESEVLRRPTEC